MFRWPIQHAPGCLHVGPPERLSLPKAPYEMAQSSTGAVLASVNSYNGVVLHRDGPGKPIPLGPHPSARYVAVSPDGQWVATGGFGYPGHAKIWDARTGQLQKHLLVGIYCRVAFSADSKRLLTNGGGDWASGGGNPPQGGPL